MLEKIIEEESDNPISPVWKSLVIASTKLFFKRAPEMHGILGLLYKMVLKHSQDADLRQTVMFYYKLLQQDSKAAEEIILASHPIKDEFFEDTQSEKRERLFLEFNSLSVVYDRPSEKFLKDKALKQSLASEKKYFSENRGFKNVNESEIQTQLLQDNDPGTGGGQEPMVDLLDMGGSSMPQ